MEEARSRRGRLIHDAGSIAAAMSEAEASVTAPSPVLPFNDPSRRSRLVKVVAWLVGTTVVLAVLELLGVDVLGWLSDLWDQIKAVPVGYIVAALVFQTGQTLLAGVSYYGILRAAYPGQVELWPIVTAYAVGVSMNNFLPANIGTFVTLVMFVAIIPGATFAGSIAAYLVQKIFFTIAGTFVYLYLFLSVPDSFDENLGNLSAHPVLSILIAGGAVLLVVILGRVFWKQVKKLWAQAKQGGAILSRPKEYLTHAFLPSLLSWLCKLAVIGIFLAAFAIPVTFESIMWVVGSGSLANVVSFTPGAVGITQATNALALDTCCDVANDTAVDYSTAQQLITTAWNVLVAIVLVVLVFGWTGGKLLVGESYVGAKEKVAEQKAQRAEKRAEKRAARDETEGGFLRRLRDGGSEEDVPADARMEQEENAMASAPEPTYGQSTAWQPERPRLRPFPLLVSWIVTGVAVMVASGILPGVHIDDFWGALLIAAIVAALNAVIPPVLAALRLPLTLVLGFLLVLIADAVILLIAADVTDGVLRVDNFGWALLAALVVAAVSVVLDVALGRSDDTTT